MREGWRGSRGRRGRGAAPPAVVVVAVMMMTSALPQRHYVLEADVRLRGVVDAVGDGDHGDGGDRAAAGPVTAVCQHTWGKGWGHVTIISVCSH